MQVVSYTAAGLLAVVFIVAGVAKINRPRETATALRAMGLPMAGVLARAMPLGELALAVGLLVSPPIGGALTLVLVSVFSAVLVRSMGTETGCGCFGSIGTGPVSRSDLVRNAALAALAAVAVLTA